MASPPVGVATKRLFPHAWAPARQRRTVEGEPVAEKLLAAKQLKIWVLQPTIAQDLIGEILHVLQDGEPGHQPRGERRLPRPVGINRAEALLEKARKFPASRPGAPTI